jgi:hypothetical protein
MADINALYWFADELSAKALFYSLQKHPSNGAAMLRGGSANPHKPASWHRSRYFQPRRGACRGLE